jgi:2-polyprenyl-3-methyl-5-hydroxy-6-metoxy-1,4-benzoquinol methylase/GT2 family glycosyltransferase
MKITAIVPTYQRPTDLKRCLEAFKKQTRPVDQLFVIVRDTDAESWTFLQSFNSEFLPLQPLKVKEPGVIAAMNCGLNEACGDIIAFTDDDAAPRPQWLERIESYFLTDERIGGVGGRDFVYYGTQESWILEGERQTVGLLQWHGRMIGNHHLGIGEPREVDVIKGVNMSFRKSAVEKKRFDCRMRGGGAQVHFELEFCLSLKKEGWKLIYDPCIAVDHYNSPRFDEDQRDQFSEIAIINISHNETLALLESFGFIRRCLFLSWAILIGNRATPGFLQLLRLLPSEGKLARKKLFASLKGRWQGWQTWHQSLSCENQNQSTNIFQKEMNQMNAESFWNKIYEENPTQSPDENNPILLAALAHFGDNIKGSKLLDLGCGNGSSSLFFAKQGANVTSVDISEVAIQSLSQLCMKNNINNITPVKSSAFNIAELGSFDFVFGSMILHHLEPFEVFAETLKESMSPGGKAFFYENNALSNLLIWFRTHLVGKYGIPKYGDNDEFPLTPAEVETLKKNFTVDVEHPKFVFFGLVSIYLLRGHLHSLLQSLDNYVGQFTLLRKYSYLQYLLLKLK